MKATRHGMTFYAAFTVTAVTFILTGCKSTSSADTALSGGSSAYNGTAGVGLTGSAAVTGGTGASVTAVPTGTGGSVAGGATGTGKAGSSAPLTRCEAEKPLCEGLSGCALGNCGRKRTNQMPITCSCLSGDALGQCCAEVKTAMGDCLDLTEYPECVKAAQCPASVLQSLANNPYKGVNKAASSDCQKCLCDNCGPELSYVEPLGETGVKLLQCALANGTIKDCIVCNPPPCDTTTASNLMTGPCSQEAVGACPTCKCTGFADPNCFSLTNCLVIATARQLPCSAAHATLECMASKCPTCGTFPTCPSNLTPGNL